MNKHGQYFELPAVKGIQAEKPYYITMCPLNLVVNFFKYTDYSLPIAMREQRILNKKRIPEIKNYIIQNRDSYIFSALTASIDGEIEFLSKDNSPCGRLKISMDSRIIINDGQHRRAAIEMALQECPDLRYEDISIVLYYDLGLAHSQQMFSDLNRYAVRPTKSLNILFDNRDKFSIIIKECIDRIPVFFNSVENEKSSISNRSKALFTLSGIFHATKLFLYGYPLPASTTEVCDIIIDFWNAVAANMPIWEKAKNKEISPEDFRKSYICAHTITLKAIGYVGNMLLKTHVKKENWEHTLHFLQEINWNKDNIDFQGLVIINGKISSSQNNEKAFADYLKEKSILIGE